MKQFYKIVIALLILTVNINIKLSAQNFNLVDINAAKDANPSNNSVFDQPMNDFLYGKFEYAVLDNIAYFTADDGIHGAELWRSDGTAAGTKMVKDINPGPYPSQVSRITVSGNKIFFRADDGGFYGQELWVSDGTQAGTFMVKDISPFGSSTPSFLTDVNGTLYFFATYYSNADELWKSDGTSEGTTLVTDFYFELGSSNATQLTNVNGHLFFVLDQFSPELYTSDGNPGGTHLVKDINPFGGSNPSQLTAVNNLLCFAADDGTGKQVWVSDGTDAGTFKANNPDNILVNDFYGTQFAVKNNNVYFSGDINDGDGSRLCTYNTANATGKVRASKDINPGFLSNNLYNIINVNGTIFFTVFNGIDQVLWKSDGTMTGTVQVKDINPGGRNVYLYKDFENANGTLLFSFYDDANGYEVWKSDGTEQGTVIVKEINPGVYSSQAANITYTGNSISLFEATNGKKGLELWKTDGTDAGTTLVKDINTSTSGSSNPYALTPSVDNSKLFFVATDPQYGTELRITGESEQGVHVVNDLLNGSFSSAPFLLVNFKNETFFFANILDTSDHTSSDIRTHVKLCRTNGTQSGTKILSLPSLEALINGGYGYIYGVEATSDLLFISFFNYSTYSYELWRTNGTDAGTFAVKTDIAPYFDLILKAVGNKVYFANYDFTYGVELYASDGSVAGTALVKDINPGFNSSSPSDLTSFDGRLYFTADYGFGPFLWVSDGTDAGTKQVKPATQLSYYSNLVPANGKLFFYGLNTVGKGSELYANDGTDNRTYLVKDIYKGPGSSNISSLTGGDTVLYFFADDGKHGSELWKSNGTKEGTILVKNISPDIESTFPYNMIAVHNQLYFTLNDILWQSDGTKKGTHEVDDANLNGVIGLTFFKAFDNKLAFTGFTPSTGTELYIGDAANNNFIVSTEANNAISTPVITTLNANIYPNPTTSNATVAVTGKFKDVTISIANVSGKILLQNSYSNQSVINLPTEKLASGTYIITIKSKDETKTLKLVKE